MKERSEEGFSQRLRAERILLITSLISVPRNQQFGRSRLLYDVVSINKLLNSGVLRMPMENQPDSVCAGIIENFL